MTVGLKATADGLSGALQVAGSDVLRFGADTSGQLVGFRNHFINGAMAIDAEFSGVETAIANSTQKYILDMMVGYVSGAATTFKRVYGSVSGYSNGTHALSINGAAGLTLVELSQRVESLNCSDLSGGPVAMSCWVNQSSGAPMSVAADIYRANSTDVFSATTLDATLVCSPATVPTGVWTRVICTGTLTSAAVTGIQAKLRLSGALGAGSAATFTGFQLEKGSIATPFEIRPIEFELAQCQRYYEIGSEPLKYISGLSGVTLAYDECRFQTRKRVAATMTLTGWQYYSASTGAAFTPANVVGAYDKFTWQSGAVTDWRGWNGVGTWTANARLI